MSDSPLPEPVDDFLQHPPSLRTDPEWQEKVFQQTARKLRRPRRWMIAVAAGIMLAILSSYFLWRGTKGEPAPPGKNLAERKRDPVPDKPKPAFVPVAADPYQLEWSAFDAEKDQERAQLYFRAGDLYFTAQNDFDAALRCYHQALHYCEARELEFNPNDNWLVMALKQELRKEP
jgi:hypothetical protein